MAWYKKLSEAVTQLFGYTTWKDTKSSLIIFNKDTKDFQLVRNNIQNWIKDNTLSAKQLSGNSWQCKITRPNENLPVDVNISVYDLYIN